MKRLIFHSNEARYFEGCDKVTLRVNAWSEFLRLSRAARPEPASS